MQKKSKPFASFVVSCIILGTIFLWALPEIGHRILLANDYNMKESHVYSGSPLDCSKIESERVDAKFLWVYPYTAIIMRGCRYEYPSLIKKGEYVRIITNKPHTFFYYINRPFSEMKVGSFKIILNEERF